MKALFLINSADSIIRKNEKDMATVVEALCDVRMRFRAIFGMGSTGRWHH
jgi:hypothetical protein